jgi:methylmalonyl-CoA/ethylmalonyl-CoA epimerase
MSSETTLPTLKPHHLGISVPDLDAAITWYGDMLGFKVEKRLNIPPAKAEVAFLRQGDFSIELFEVENAAPLPESRRAPNTDLATHGTKHICFEVKDLRSLIKELKPKGLDVAMDVFQMEDTLAAFVRDNSGVLIELMQIVKG